MNLRTMLLLAGVLLILSDPCASAHTDVTAHQVRDLIDTTDGLVIIDVREPYEYCDVVGHIPAALNYPWSSGVLQARYEELPTDGPILVICRSGGRSNAAANFLDSNGFLEVYDMLGGMSAWQWETAPCKYNGGSGTPDDPYQIATAADLMLLGETPEDYDKHFILTADIDLNPNLPGRKVFNKAVIAFVIDDVTDNTFHGSFDGNGHTISNLVIEGGGYYIGLFGILAPGAEIKDLGVVDVNITSSDPLVGGLVGNNWDGTIANSYSSGVVTGYSHSVGGLVGANESGGTITNCFNTCTVSGNWRVGGLVGSSYGSIDMSYSNCTVSGESGVGGLVGMNGGHIDDCYVRCMVTGVSEVGGIVGQNGYDTGESGLGRVSPGLIANCYSAGIVSGESRIGGLIGYKFHLLNKTAASFWNAETSGQPASDGGIGLTTTEMQTASTFLEAGWDFTDEMANGPNDIWKISEGLDYPRLWWEKYGGGTGEPNDPYLIYTAEHLNEMGAEPNNWDKHFKLMADIDLSGYSYDRAVIAPDVGGDGYTFPATPFTGVFDGNGHAVLNLTITGKSYLGLFGRLGSGAEVKGLGVVDVDITGSYYAIGGLVGDNRRGSITKCYSTGTVAGYTFVGGLVGYNQYGDIAASYSTCTASATFSGNQNIGGLAGVNAGRITTSYSTGAVSGQRRVGGLVGRTTDLIAMCYSTGTVSGDQHVGGLVGVRDPDSGIVTDCFWDTQTSGLATSAGGIGKTTAEMQTDTTFLEAGWDLVDETTNGTEDIWWILEGQDYPRLWWEAGN